MNKLWNERRGTSLFVGLTVFAACADPTQNLPDGSVRELASIRVQPTSVDLGSTVIGVEARATVRVELTQLDAERLTAEWGTPTEPSLSFTLDRALKTVEVSFTPVARGEVTGELELRHPDIEVATRVPVRGTGLAPPGLTVTSTALVFGRTDVGGVVTRTLRVTNTSGEPIEVDVELGSCEGLAGSTFCAPERVDIAGDETAAITVAFRPTTVRDAERGLMRLRACASCAPVEVSLLGYAGPAELRCPESVELYSPTARTVTATIACEYAPFSTRRVTSWRVLGPSPLLPNDWNDSQTGPGEPVTMQVWYDGSGGARPPMLSVIEVVDAHPDGSRRLVHVPVHIRVGGSLIDVPSSIGVFTTTAAGGWAQLDVYNRGAQPLEVTGLSVVGPVSVRNFSPFAVPVGGRRRLVVEVPAYGGGRLFVSSNDVARPVSQIVVEATHHPIGACRLEYGPSRLDFGELERGRRVRRAYEVRNVGANRCLMAQAVSLVPDPIALGVTDRIDRRYLEPGHAHVVEVEFTPTELGQFDTLIGLSTRDPARPFVEVTATGVSVDSTPLIAPREVDFGEVDTGCERVWRQVTFTNILSTPIDVDDIDLVDVSDGAFILRGTPGAVTVAPAGSFTFEVGFDSPALGVRAAAVRIRAGARSWYVSLRGAGSGGRFATVSIPRRSSRPIDVLYVVDGGRAQADAARASFHELFMSPTGVYPSDYRVAVTHADPSPAYGGRLWPVGAPQIITPTTTPNPEEAFARIIESAVSHRGATQQGLHAAQLALSSPFVRGDAGFLRSEAALAVVVVTDRDDTSPAPPAQYASFITTFKSRHDVRGASLSAILTSPQSSCPGGGTESRLEEAVRQGHGGLTWACGPWLSDVFGVVSGRVQLYTIDLPLVVGSILGPDGTLAVDAEHQQIAMEPVSAQTEHLRDYLVQFVPMCAPRVP